MADDGQVQGMLVAVFWDSGNESPEEMEQFVKLSIKNAPRRVKGTASVATVLYTQDGEYIDHGFWARQRVSDALRDAADDFIDELKKPEETL